MCPLIRKGARAGSGGLRRHISPVVTVCHPSHLIPLQGGPEGAQGGIRWVGWHTGGLGEDCLPAGMEVF